MKLRATCSVAVAPIRRRPMLVLGAGIGALAAVRPSLIPSAAMRVLQVTPSIGLNGSLWHYRSQSSLSKLFSLSPADSIMTSLKPPQAAPKWTHTPEEVLKLTKEAIEEERNRLDEIGGLKSEDCTFESVRSRFHATFRSRSSDCTRRERRADSNSSLSGCCHVGFRK